MKPTLESSIKEEQILFFFLLVLFLLRYLGVSSPDLIQGGMPYQLT